MQLSKWFKTILATLCLGINATSYASEDEWRHEFSPYFFAASLKGENGVQGVTSDIDMNFSDIWDNLDAGAMALFESGKDRWFYILEGLYFKISDEGLTSISDSSGNTLADNSIEITTPMYLFQTLGGYRLLDDKTKFDVLGGLRYTRVEVEAEIVTTTPGILFPGGSRKSELDEGWTDFIVGARVLHPIAKDWFFLGVADVGAGGSDFTYNVITGVNWKFKKDYTAKFTYRHIYWDYNDNGFLWDMTSSGLMVGLGIQL